MILTRFTDQAAILYEMQKDSAQKPFLLTGEMPKKEREAAIRQMAEVMPQESMLLVATGQLVGEGFDYPRLDTLFLATPETKSQGLFHQIQKEVTFCGLPHGADA